MSEKRAAGFVIYRPDPAAAGRPRFLLLRTRKGGHWSPPKGHLEPGETERDAALRELREEAGLAPRAIDPAFRVDIQYDVEKGGRAIPKNVTYFLAEAAPGDCTISDEHTDHVWATLEEAREMIEFENLRRVLETAAAHLGDRRPGGRR